MNTTVARLALLVMGVTIAVGAAIWVADAQQPQPPAAKLEIVQPPAGALLSGIVEVRVKVIPATDVPILMVAAVSGPPYVTLTRVGQTDEWSGELDTSLVPNGAAKVLAIGRTAAARRVMASVGVAVQNGLRCFIGDLHGHTYYSDGTLFPKDAHDYARNVAKLDFFSLTDHLESVDELEWADTRQQAWSANEDGKFVSILGLEWTKGLGHANIYDPPTRIWPTDKEGFYQAVADAGCIGKFNHPGDGSKVFGGLEYSEVGDKAMELMEVRGDAEQQAFIRALKNGWHIAPDGSTDTHSPNWGNLKTWTGVVAPGLSRQNIWRALKNRHCYSTHDRNCELYFWVNGSLMGDIIEVPSTAVSVDVLVSDPDKGDTIAKIELFEDGSVVQTDEPKAQERRWQTTCSPQPGKHFYFVKVTQTDQSTMWSAPVWLEKK